MSIDPGQMEASRSLGFSHFRSMILVVLLKRLKTQSLRSSMSLLLILKILLFFGNWCC